MKKQILTAACTFFLAVGVANAQIVIRIGPPPPRPVEVAPAPPPVHRDWVWVAGYHRWNGHAYVWVPAPTAVRRIAAPSGSRASGVPSAAATSGMLATGVDRYARSKVHGGCPIHARSLRMSGISSRCNNLSCLRAWLQPCRIAHSL